MYVVAQIITINGQFPGPQLQTVTDVIVSLTVHNGLDEPFLLTWYTAHHETPHHTFVSVLEEQEKSQKRARVFLVVRFGSSIKVVIRVH